MRGSSWLATMSATNIAATTADTAAWMRLVCCGCSDRSGSIAGIALGGTRSDEAVRFAPAAQLGPQWHCEHGTRLQVSERVWTERDAYQPAHLPVHVPEHAAQLAVLAFGERRLDPRVGAQPIQHHESNRPVLDAIDRDAVCQRLDLLLCHLHICGGSRTRNQSTQALS